MNPLQKGISLEVQPSAGRRKRPESDVAIQCRHSTPDPRRLLPSFEANTKRPVSPGLRRIQASKVLPMLTSESEKSFISPQLIQESPRSSITASNSLEVEQSHPDHQALLPPLAWASRGTVTPPKFRDSPTDKDEFTETESKDRPGPAPKRFKLSDDGWIEQALKRGQEERRAPDPYPMPHLTPPGRLWESQSHLQPHATAQQQQQPRAPPPPQWLSPPGFGRSPPTRSATLSRRPSSAYSTSSPSHSPALTHTSTTSANRRGPPSPSDGSTMGGFSDLEIGSRAASRAPEAEEFDATFSQIHDIPRIELPARMTTNVSKLEQLPKKVFMRIMMYCGYKAQVLLKKCSYKLYITVDLEAIPWEDKTSTILFEERYNPRNFPKKPLKSRNEEEDGSNDDEVVDQTKRATKRKKARTKAVSISPTRAHSKTNAHVESYGKWGCYSCYKILPAYYFEGALLEDKEGRTPKSNKLRGADAAEADKKVDMRVEYVQILGSVRGSRLPEWLSNEKTYVHATNIESYLRKNMEVGVECDDLRNHYRNITRDTHLVAPIRGITPVFTPSSALSSSTKRPIDATVSTRLIYPQIPATKSPEEAPTMKEHLEPCRPLYKIQAGNPTQIDGDSATYTYQINIPRAAKRDTRPLLLPKTEPVSKIWLPQKTTSPQEPVLEVGDVVSLRRICIPCGTRFAVYRRNCNRKIISKTDEQWWVCDCPEVRLAGMSTGCSACGRKVIY